MAINSTFYLNADNLAAATTVYLDFQLLNVAPNGFYGDGTIVREQYNGILYPPQECSNCPVACSPDLISTNNLVALYSMSFSVGTSTDGPIIIYFYPQENPDGILVTYNGVKYNKLSCSIDGLHQSTNPLSFTFAGGEEIGCLETLPTTLNLPIYNYNSGWVNSGSIVPYTIQPGDVSLSDPIGSASATWVMVIPKTTSIPTDINVEIISPCINSKCDVVINCPAVLDRTVMGSDTFPSDEIDCTETIEFTYYSVKVHDDASVLIGLYDYMFTDDQGQNALENGYYLIENDYGGTPTTEVIQVENGIVVAITPCL